MASTQIRIATAQYPLIPFHAAEDWKKHLSSWVEKAAHAGAQLLLFPEYGSTDLGFLGSDPQLLSANDFIETLQQYKDLYLETYMNLAHKYGVYIVSGGMPVIEDDGHYNRSYFFSPKSMIEHQDKLILTQFEREKTSLSAGKETTIFTTEFGHIAIAICFDAQFPNLVRRLAENGCDVLLVPSCTGSLKGYNRVKIGCQARALENQIAVVSSVTVGDAKWQPIADTNCGAAGTFTPPDYGFPDDGILTLGELNKPGWIYTDLDLEKFKEIRKNGHVRNWECWPEQNTILGEPLLYKTMF